MKRTLPTPEFVTAELDHRTTVYGWKVEGYGIIGIGNSRQEAISDFKEAYHFEYDEKF